MKRPLALIGLTLISVLTVCFYLGSTASLILIITSLAGFAVSLIFTKLRKIKTFAFFFAAVFIGATFFSVYSDFYVKPLSDKYGDNEHSVVATFCEEGIYNNGTYFYEIRTESIDNENVNTKIALHTEEAIICKAGDRISFRSFIGKENFGSYLADGMYLTANIYEFDEYEVIHSDSPSLQKTVINLRDKLRSAFYLELEYDNAAFASAIMLGDDSGFDEDTYSDLRHAGLTHVVVVSGLHLSIITMLYNRTFGKLIKNKYINAASTVLLVMFFLCLTGFGKSSIRAAVMLFVLIASRLFNRISDSVNSLGLAALVLCVPNPYIVGDIGVLLSFSATFGITAFGGKIEKSLNSKLLIKSDKKKIYEKLNKVIKYFIALFACSFTAIMATLPVTVIFFGKVSLVQLLTNLCILPVVQYFIIFASLTAVFHFIPLSGLPEDIFAFATDAIGNFILNTAKWFASFPMSYVKADYRFVVFWVFSYILLFAVAYNVRKQGKGLNLICLGLSFAIFISGMSGHVIANKDTLNLYVFPSKDSYSLVLSKGNGNILIGTSGSKFTYSKIINTLDTLYSKNQLMIVEGGSESFDEKAEIILSKFDYERVLVYDNNSGFVDYSAKDTEQGSEYFGENLWGCVDLYVINKDKSFYTYFSYGGSDVLCLPSEGDVNDIPGIWHNPDILITSGLIDNMDKLKFQKLIVNGTILQQSAVINCFKNRNADVIALSDTVILDIKG